MSSVVAEARKRLTLFLVQKHIFCPISGKVLDIRTVKCLVDKDGDPFYPLDPEVFDKVSKDKDKRRALAHMGYFFPKE